MKSVFAFFHEVCRNEIMNNLNSLCNNYQDKQWVYLKHDDPVLYIAFDDEKYFMDELDPEVEQDEKFRTLLEEGGYNLILQIDISGRYSGMEEVLFILRPLLSKFDGVAIDDNMAHIEILNR